MKWGGITRRIIDKTKKKKCDERELEGERNNRQGKGRWQRNKSKGNNIWQDLLPFKQQLRVQISLPTDIWEVSVQLCYILKMIKLLTFKCCKLIYSSNRSILGSLYPLHKLIYALGVLSWWYSMKSLESMFLHQVFQVSVLSIAGTSQFCWHPICSLQLFDWQRK